MNSRSTWWLFTAALALLAFIFFYERHLHTGPELTVAADVFQRLSPAEVTAIEIKYPKETIRVERRNGSWRMSAPVAYAVDVAAINRFLDACLHLKRDSLISVEEMAAQPRGLAEFGLQPPHAVINFEMNGRTLEARVGSRTPVGSQLNLQVGDDLEVQVVKDSFLEQLPQSSADWRNHSLLDLAPIAFNRVEVRNGRLGFEVQRDATNQMWQLTKPPPVKRADNAEVKDLLERLRSWPVQQFETDDPAVDLTRYGLQPPETELVLGQGTNDLVVVQFGKAPTNDASLVYARRLSNTNIVLVPRDVLENTLRQQFEKFRDTRLIIASPPLVDQIEVRGLEHFTLRRQPDFNWVISGVTNLPADPELVRNFMKGLWDMRVVDFVADVVADYAKYGLTQPALQYTISMAVTNSGTITNQVLTQLDFGTVYEDKIHVRRVGEESVYGALVREAKLLPQQAFLLRDRRIWSFTATNLTGLTFEMNGKSRHMIRNATGAWILAPGSVGIVPSTSFRFETSLDRLGELRAEEWVEKGAERFAYWGITAEKPKLTLEFDPALQMPPRVLRFGRQGASLRPYASVDLDGAPVVFEFPIGLYIELSQDLELPRLVEKR